MTPEDLRDWAGAALVVCLSAAAALAALGGVLIGGVAAITEFQYWRRRRGRFR